MSKIITFYSYKGGVGRSMALVNVAALLSKWGKKVLMIDWDLEAPGLEIFFRPYLSNIDWRTQRGVLDLLLEMQKSGPASLKESILTFSIDPSYEPLGLMVSGKSNEEYSDQLRNFNVSDFYQRFDGANSIERFRKTLLSKYDYILIDSRTGVTDFGGICTIQMPDIIIMLLTATEQGLNGTIKIAQKIRLSQASLPFDREKPIIFPIPSRIDQSEYSLTQEWLDRIGDELNFCFDDWLPIQIKLRDFIRLIKIPYVPYFSYGEKLSVTEHNNSDPASLGYAFENLAMVIGNNLEKIDVFVKNRGEYVKAIIDQSDVAEWPDLETTKDTSRAILSKMSVLRKKINTTRLKSAITYLLVLFVSTYILFLVWENKDTILGFFYTKPYLLYLVLFLIGTIVGSSMVLNIIKSLSGYLGNSSRPYRRGYDYYGYEEDRSRRVLPDSGQFGGCLLPVVIILSVLLILLKFFK